MIEIKFNYVFKHKTKGDIIRLNQHIEEIEMFDRWQDDPDVKDYKLIARCQFIGTKDKYGDEVYYKDIVEFCGFRYVIEWDDRRACFYGRQLRNKDIPYTGGIKTAQFFRQCEVIGNVYDSPDLLENKNDK